MAKIIFLSCEAQTLFCHSSKQSYLSKATLNEWLKLKNFPLLYLEKIFLKHILYIASCLETCRRFFTIKNKINVGNAGNRLLTFL